MEKRLPVHKELGFATARRTIKGVPRLMASWRGLRIAHVRIVPCGKTVTSDFYVEKCWLLTGDRRCPGLLYLDTYLICCLWVIWIFIWVKFECQPSICFLYFFLSCCFGQAKQFIQGVPLCSETKQIIKIIIISTDSIPLLSTIYIQYSVPKSQSCLGVRVENWGHKRIVRVENSEENVEWNILM